MDFGKTPQCVSWAKNILTCKYSKIKSDRVTRVPLYYFVCLAEIRR